MGELLLTSQKESESTLKLYHRALWTTSKYFHKNWILRVWKKQINYDKVAKWKNWTCLLHEETKQKTYGEIG